MTPVTEVVPQLIDHDAERLLFRDLRWRIGKTLFRQAIGQSRLRASVISILSVIFWFSMFGMLYHGFQLLNSMISHAGSRAQMVHAIFNIFYLMLLTMMSISSAIIIYGGLFRAPDLRFLLTSPIRPKRIVWHKLQETLVFSGWGFFLMGSPPLIAYGLSSHAPWYYYVLLPFFMGSFVVIPVCTGTLLCLVVVRYMPWLRYHAVAITGIFTLLAMVAIGFNVVHAGSSPNLLTPQWFHDTISRLEFAQQRAFPSWWLSTGVLEAANEDVKEGRHSLHESLGFLALLTSHAVLGYGIVGGLGARLFLPGYHGLSNLVPVLRGYRAFWLDRWLEKLLAWGFPLPMRLLLLKDIKVFRRDPLQWLQGAVFGGLLGIYFFQLRRLYFQDVMARWILMISFLNVAVIGLMMATFTTRFIFPLLSLEGRRIWILATLPVRRDWLLWNKFLFGCAISLPPCCVLITLSDIMLQINKYSGWVFAMHLLTGAVLCLALSGVAVGLGARFPNLRENSPAKIASGFGGTLTLVLSSIMILLAAVATAVPTFLWMRATSPGSDLSPQLMGWAMAGGTLLMLVAGLMMTIIPMRVGLRHFREMEL